MIQIQKLIAQLLLLFWQGASNPFVVGLILGLSIGFLAGRNATSHLVRSLGKACKVAARIVGYLALALAIAATVMGVAFINKQAFILGGSWVFSVWLCAIFGWGWTITFIRHYLNSREQLKPRWLWWLIVAVFIMLPPTWSILTTFCVVGIIMPRANNMPIIGWQIICLMAGLMLPSSVLCFLIFEQIQIQRWRWWRRLRRHLSRSRMEQKKRQAYFQEER